MEGYFMRLNLYRHGETDQHWRKEKEFDFENEYIILERIDSSNKPGGVKLYEGSNGVLLLYSKWILHILTGG